MKIVVLGGYGMLGRAVAQAGREAGHDVVQAGHERDVANLTHMRALARSERPHYVVNCAGAIPHRGARIGDFIHTNALGPWIVWHAFQHSRVIQVSTDCVFKGDKAIPYTVLDPPDATDYYGLYKAYGEVPDTIVVRTSFIGLGHGLLHWFLSQPKDAVIDGWDGVLWSGATAMDVARELVRMAESSSYPNGIYHLAAPAITKYDLLVTLRELFNLPWEIEIRRCDKPIINRALKPSLDLPRDWNWLRDEVAREVLHAS